MHLEYLTQCLAQGSAMSVQATIAIRLSPGSQNYTAWLHHLVTFEPEAKSSFPGEFMFTPQHTHLEKPNAGHLVQ